MKVAIVHDWLFHMRGGEKVLECIAELYPDATIYTLFYDRKKLSPSLKEMKMKASFMQRLPGIQHYYRWLLPFLPNIIESMKIEEADIVISSSHCVAKGIKIPKNAKHYCYCHTPMRYIWGFEDVYFKRCPFFLKPVLNWIIKNLQAWDIKSSKQVDQFIANAKNVAGRIKKIYDKDAVVIYPPLDTDFYYPEGTKKDYYLVVSAFVPYKRIDLVIETFNELDKRLFIVGGGPLASTYQKKRKSSKISFLGSVPGKELRKIYSEAKALIFPTNEDFGIVPLEAQSCGTPIIAYGKGGALESVQEGIFFQNQTVESLTDAVEEFEKRTFVGKDEISRSVQKFSRTEFKKQLQSLVESEEPELSHANNN